MCKKCPTAAARERHAEQARQGATRKRASNKSLVIEAYGAACACCGESEPAFLTIDHVNNDGARHREVIGHGVRRIGSGSVMHAWLVENNFPEGFQLLCANCNMAKAALGQCPHRVRVAQ
jgi:hypothetical protein